MTLYSSTFWQNLLSNFSHCFTKSSFENFQTLIAGWVLTPGRKTITHMIQAVGATLSKHHSCFYNFFSRAKWDIDVLSELVAKMIVRLLIRQGDI